MTTDGGKSGRRQSRDVRSSTILIADDERLTRDRIASGFRAAGWVVTVATSYKEALVTAARMPPAHAIVEQRFADGSGLDLIHRLSAIRPGLLAVVLTRYPSVAAAVQAMRLGFRDYLPKPLDWERLAPLFDLPPANPPARGANDTGSDASEPPSLARAEWEHIQATLFACGGNISAAARRLHLHRRSLQRKLQRNAPR